MLPECCNLRPVVLGEEPGFSEGRLQVGKPLGASRKKGFLKEGRARSSWFLVQTPADGWGLKQHQPLPLLQSRWTTLVWGT